MCTLLNTNVIQVFQLYDYSYEQLRDDTSDLSCRHLVITITFLRACRNSHLAVAIVAISVTTC